MRKSVINKMKIIIRDYLQTSTQYIFFYLLLLLLYVDNLLFFVLCCVDHCMPVLLIHTLQQPPHIHNINKSRLQLQ